MAGVWVWTGHMWNERIRFVLEKFGDRLTDVSLFAWSVNVRGELRQTFNPSLLDEYRAKWPHIRFWGCFRNMDDPDNGAFEIFEALRSNGAARSRLADQVQSEIFEKYPWIYGVDIDLELGHNGDPAASESIFAAVANRAHSLGRKASAALPPLTIDGSIGGENWVRYKQLGALLDHVAVMSYDFAWGGSAPGPISPGWWLEQVYDWATSQISPAKLSMGLPAYGRFWGIHRYYGSNEYRGTSGTYYAGWQLFTGVAPWEGHYKVGWVLFRDPGSRSLWGITDCYDWRHPNQVAASKGMRFGTFNERRYAVRYGLPAGSPQWSVADNSMGSALAQYSLRAEPVVDNTGATVSPKDGFTLTLEVLKRPPVAATIIDDSANSSSQLSQIYAQPDGKTWKFAEVTDTYRQYRGRGRLQYAHNFGRQAIYAQARFQFAKAGSFSVAAHGITAQLSSGGRLRLMQGGTVLAEQDLGPRIIGAEAGAGRQVLALRVREGSARVYFGASETRLPRVLNVPVSPVFDGVVEFSATGEAWVDHTYLGDGWWYQPREAVSLELNGQRRQLGRIARTGIRWDGSNRFRPVNDVDENETRTDDISLDWDFEHWIGAPVEVGRDALLTLRPIDHDVWAGRILAVDRTGASMGYFSDAETITHWSARATLDWGLQGIALWSLGQEDVRLWETLAGGELPPSTKRLND